MSAFQKALEWAGPGLLSGAFGLIGGQRMNRRAARVAREQMAFQAQQQQIAMEFGERMSSTAHQRQMADLRAAGLNPILAAHGGASSPSVGMGSGAMPPVVDPLGAGAEAAVATGLSARQQNQELKNLRSQKRLTDHDARATKAIADREEAQNRALGFNRRPDGSIHMDFSMPNITDIVQADIASAQAQARLQNSSARLNELGAVDAALQARISQSRFGRAAGYVERGSRMLPSIYPILRAPLSFGGGGSSARSRTVRPQQRSNPNIYRRRGAGFR